MSRKDTILVAILINACLLVVLFVSSIKKESKMQHQEEASIAYSLPNKHEEIQTLAKEAPKQPEPVVVTPKPQVVKPIAPKKQVEKKPVEKVVPKDEKYVFVTIKKGDALDKIAKQYGVTTKEIIQASGLSSTRLQIGQILKVPKKLQQKTERPNEKKARYYTVKGGDNPWTIAKKNQIKLEDLLRMNGLSEEQAKKLRPGDKLRIE